MKIKNYIKKAFLLATLPFVMWLSYGYVAFWHSHVLDNGTVIHHSHPINGFPQPGTPFPKHSHTDHELFLLSLIGNFTVLLAVLLVLGCLALTLAEKNIGARRLYFIKPAHLYGSYLRGPPIY